MKNCESYVLEKGIRHTFASHFPGLSSHRLTTFQPPFLLLFLLPRNLSLPAHPSHPSHPSHPPTHSSHSGRIVMHHFFLSFFIWRISTYFITKAKDSHLPRESGSARAHSLPAALLAARRGRRRSGGWHNLWQQFGWQLDAVGKGGRDRGKERHVLGIGRYRKGGRSKRGRALGFVIRDSVFRNHIWSGKGRGF